MIKQIVGQILKPQGIKGELKVKSLCDGLLFEYLKTVFIGVEKSQLHEYKITNARLDAKGFAYLLLLGVDNRNDAELFKDKLIFINEELMPALEKGTFYVRDLVGCELIACDGEILGTIIRIDDFGTADVITAKKENGELRFPHLERVVKEINIKTKKCIVIKEEFEKVVVYD